MDKFKTEKTIHKFHKDFFEANKYDALFTSILNQLIRGASPYEVIEQLFEVQERQRTHIKSLIENNPTRLIVSKENFEYIINLPINAEKDK